MPHPVSFWNGSYKALWTECLKHQFSQTAMNDQCKQRLNIHGQTCISRLANPIYKQFNY